METGSFSTNQKLTITLILVILGTAGLYFIGRNRTAPNVSSESPSATTNVGDATSAPRIPGKGMVELVPITNFTAPNISMSPNFAASVSSDVRTAINTRLTKDRDAIQEFPTDFNTWIDVGVQYKNGGDYVMAVKVWDYASKKWPSNVISFNNLGDLYMNYTLEYAKAEKNYLADINIKPEDINGYSTLFELYTATSYHPSATSAEDILKKGIAANPNAFDLRVTLARYYKAAGRTADAKVQYDAATASAKAAGKNDVAAQIQQEAISSQ